MHTTFPKKNIGELLRICHGKSQASVIEENGDFPILATGGEIGRSSKSLYDKPSVLIGRKGTIDQPQYTEKPFWSIDTLYYSNIGPQALPKFIFYVFQAIPWKQYNEASGVPSLTASRIESIEIPAPSLAEQRRIAAILTDLDDLIDAQEALIAKKTAIKEATMELLLTGKKRLPGFSEVWKSEVVDKLGFIKTGKKDTQDKVDTGEYPFYVRSAVVENIDQFSYDEEAVLTAGDGVGTGKIFHYVNGKYEAHQRVYRMFSFKECIHGLFFFFQFQRCFYSRFSQMSAKSSVDSIRREMIADMPVQFPGSIDEQKQIIAICVNLIDDLTNECEVLAKLNNKKKSVMHKLLTGEIRVPETPESPSSK